MDEPMELNTEPRHNPQPWGDGEIDTIYVEPNNRFVVSLVVGYSEEEIVPSEFPRTPEGALAAAISLTRDEGSPGTVWFVYDRKTKTMHQLTQRDARRVRGLLDV